MEKKMETTIMGYKRIIGCNIGEGMRSWPSAGVNIKELQT